MMTVAFGSDSRSAHLETKQARNKMNIRVMPYVIITALFNCCLIRYSSVISVSVWLDSTLGKCWNTSFHKVFLCLCHSEMLVQEQILENQEAYSRAHPISNKWRHIRSKTIHRYPSQNSYLDMPMDT